MLASAEAQEVIIRSSAPTYETALPDGYQPTLPREQPPRYRRSSGPEDWAKIHVSLVPGARDLEQNPLGVTAAEILPLVALPKDATSTFTVTRWKDVFIGTLEYRAVVENMPRFGIAAVVPISGKPVILTVSAPTLLETEVRKDFRSILTRLPGPTRWHSPEELLKIRRLEGVGKAGAGLLLLYAVAWVTLFRGYPLRAHVLRTAWLAAIAILLFIPMLSPGEMSLFSNLLVNGVLPLAFLLFAAHRIKMAIETS